MYLSIDIALLSNIGCSYYSFNRNEYDVFQVKIANTDLRILFRESYIILSVIRVRKTSLFITTKSELFEHEFDSKFKNYFLLGN